MKSYFHLQAQNEMNLELWTSIGQFAEHALNCLNKLQHRTQKIVSNTNSKICVNNAFQLTQVGAHFGQMENESSPCLGQ